MEESSFSKTEAVTVVRALARSADRDPWRDRRGIVDIVPFVDRVPKLIGPTRVYHAFMTRTFALALLLCSSIGLAQDAVRQLAPGVYLRAGHRDRRQPANCTWVVFRDYVVVLDGNFPWGAREILPEIKRTTDKPIRYVFNTHYHGDHSYGNSLYVDQGAAVVSSVATAEEMRTRGVAGWTNWHEAHSLEGARPEPASIAFSDRLILDDGTQRVEFIREGPGHTAGDSVAYLPKQKILVTGDLCVTWPFGNNVADAAADYDGWLHALDRMASWGIDTVVPGHGPTGPVSVLRVQRDYLADMLAQVRAGIQAGKSADDLARTIDLRKHGTIANDAEANASSIRAMYRHLTAR